MKLTPWFPPEVNPVRFGLYPREWVGLGLSFEECMDLWNGEEWVDPNTLQPFKFSRRWRGLAKQPKEQA